MLLTSKGMFRCGAVLDCWTEHDRSETMQLVQRLF